MKKLLVMTFLLLGLTSCGSDYNSNYGDYAQYGPIEGIDSSTPDGARLLDAYKVMQTNKCFQCHGDFASFKTSAAWVSSPKGIVVAGSPSSSTVFTRLINNGGDMPQNGSQLTTEEVAKIEAWISGI
jgi:mono/diheme cytochrome c family protein